MANTIRPIITALPPSTSSSSRSPPNDRPPHGVPPPRPRRNSDTDLPMSEHQHHRPSWYHQERTEWRDSSPATGYPYEIIIDPSNTPASYARRSVSPTTGGRGMRSTSPANVRRSESLLTRAPSSQYAAERNASRTPMSRLTPLDEEGPSSLHELGRDEDVEIEVAMSRTPGLVYSEVPAGRLIPLMIGFVIITFLAGFDATSYRAAIPAIRGSYNNESLFWFTAAYTFSFHASAPLYGRYSDIFGRCQVQCASIALYAASSLAAALSSSIPVLTVCRATAGVGAAGFLSIVLIVLADLLPLRKRPVYMMLAFVGYVLGEVSGPILASALISYSSWSALFWFSMVLAVIAFALILPFLRLGPDLGTDDPPLSILARLARVDFLGTTILVCAIIAFLLATVWTTSGMRDWSSGVVIGLYHTAAICIALFFVIETMAAVVPIIPSHIVEEKTVIALCLVASLVGFGWKGFLGHVPLLMQVIHGEDAVMSSVRFIPLLAGNVVCSILAATTVHRLGFRFYLASGLALFTISISLSSTLDATSGIGQEVAFFLEFGAGTGFFLPTLVIAAQAFAREADMAVVTNLIIFLINLSSTIGDVVWDGILSSRLDNIPLTTLPASDKQHVLNSIIKFSTEAERAAVVAAFVESAQFFLHAAIPLAAVAFVAAFWVEGYRFSRRS